MKKKSIIVSSFLSLGAFGAMAQATAPAPAPEPTPSPFSANINLTTKYKFRGQDQGNTNFFSPALQGGFDWSSNGFYLGNWNSNIGFTNAGLEMDFYGGYKGEIAKDFGYDVGILQYYYPQKDKEVNFNVTELYGALSWQWLTVKYSHTVSKDYFGIGAIQELAGSSPRPSGRNTGYIEAAANFPIDKWTINTHIGYTRYSSGLRNATFDGGEGAVSVGVPNYYDYKVGVTYDLGSGFSVAGAVLGASKKSFYGDINKTRAIFTLSKTM
ncbi:MAG: TorF family putative porin [Caldimonas sp.]